MKQTIINCILAAVLLFGAFIVITDKAVALLHIGQYLFNFIYFVLVIPGCISLSDITGRLHPEYYGNMDK